MLVTQTQYGNVTRTPSDTGITSIIGSSRSRSIYLSKTDTAKRVFPSDLFLSGTPFTSVKEWLSSEYCFWRTKVGPTVFHDYSSPVSYHLSQGVKPHAITSDSELVNMRVILRNRILAKARDRGVNLANMLGEYRQTASLFGDAAKRFVTITTAVVKRDPRILIHGHYYPSGYRKPGVSLRESKRLFNDYLVYIYGVKPLMQDLDDSFSAIKSRSETFQPNEVFVEYMTRKASNSVNFTSYNDSSVKGSEEYRWRVSTRAKARIYYSNQLLNNTLGKYGFTNPASLAWELLPWSFVYDWWFNFGDYLSSLDNLLYFDGTKSKVQYTQRVRVESDVKCLSAKSTYYNQSSTRTSMYNIDTLVGLHFKPNISAQHIANGLALIGSKLSDIAISSARSKRSSK